VSAILRAGRHTITLTATNSAGLQATATTELNVLGDYDGDGVPDSEDLSKGLSLSPLDGTDVFRETGGLPLIAKLARGLNPTVMDTDGDGRSDADEIAQGSDPRTPDQAPIFSNGLNATPTTFTLGYKTSAPTVPQGMVLVSSRAALTWTVSASAPWLVPTASSGTTVGTLGFVADPRGLSPGAHTGTLTFRSTDNGTTATVQVVLTVEDTGPRSSPGPLPPRRFFLPGVILNQPAE
jgi:hypothetical protein